MARGHGRILTAIWEDEDFKALGEREQRLYLFLISQPNLNHAGLLPLTLRRWASKARGLTVADLEKTLAVLEDARFVVTDIDSEELLIRTFVRNDGVWKQPKVMAAMVSGAGEISSVYLRRALLDEMDRIPLDELSDEPGARGPSVRQQIVEHLTNLRRLLRVPEPTPPNTPKAIPTDTHGEGFPKGSESLTDTPGEPTTRAHAGTSHAHSPAPAPAPTPAHYPTPSSGERASEGSAEPVARDSKGIPDRMADTFMARFARGNSYRLKPVRQVIADTLANHTDPDELWEALLRVGELSKPVTPGTLQFAFSEIRKQRDNVRQLRPSTTDERVAAGLALVAKYRAEEERAALEAAPTAPQESA